LLLLLSSGHHHFSRSSWDVDIARALLCERDSA